MVMQYFAQTSVQVLQLYCTTYAKIKLTIPVLQDMMSDLSGILTTVSKSV